MNVTKLTQLASMASGKTIVIRDYSNREDVKERLLKCLEGVQPSSHISKEEIDALVKQINSL